MTTKHCTDSIGPSSSFTYRFDSYGWPINPATGQSYSRQELIDNDTLPLPRDKFAAYSITNARLGIPYQATPKRKKSKRQSTGSRYTTRSFHAAQVLRRGEAMRELVERVNREVEEVA